MIAHSTIRAVLLAFLALGVSAAPALAVPVVNGEFEVSGLESNNKLVQGPDGNMWLTLSSVTADVAQISPDGDVDEFDLGVESPSGIAAAAGRLWITRDGGVTSFEPTAPVGTKDDTNTVEIAGNNHSIVLGPDGNLWAAGSEALVRLTPTVPSSFKVFPVAGLNSRDIDAAGAGLVIANFGGENVLTATTADPPVVTPFPVGGGPQGVAGGPGGQVAYTQPSNDPKQIGLFTPPGAALTNEFPGADPFGITFGTDGSYWSAESNFDKLIRVTTNNAVSELTGFAAGSKPRQIAAGPGNTLWVTLSNETDAKVARVSGVDPPVVTPLPTPEQPKPVPIFKPRPRTQIKGGPKGRVTTRGEKRRIKFRFGSSDLGARFQCRMKQLPRSKARKGFKSPPFTGCKSPRPYLLKPGRYRFEVRAILDGGRRDLTPAKRNFRIVRVARR